MAGRESDIYSCTTSRPLNKQAVQLVDEGADGLRVSRPPEGEAARNESGSVWQGLSTTASINKTEAKMSSGTPATRHVLVALMGERK